MPFGATSHHFSDIMDPMDPVELTVEQKLFNIKKKLNEIFRQFERMDHLDMPKSEASERAELLHPRQARAIARAALKEIEKLL